MGTPAEDAIAIVRSLAASEESYYLEFKSAWVYGPDGRVPREVREIARDIGEAVVAFANSDGGDLLVGIEDNGAITGTPHHAEHVNYLQSWRQQLQPTDGEEDPSVRVQTVEIDGVRVLLFRVEAHGGPAYVTSDGRCMMRQGARSVPASASKIERRRAQRLGDLDYETQPIASAKLEDLDWPLIRANHGQLGTSAPLRSLDDVALLRYWNLIEQHNGSVVLRRAALLLFAKEPLRWHANNRLRLRRVLDSEQGYGRDLNTSEREFVGPAAAILNEARTVLYSSLEREARGDQLFTTQHLLPREAIDECLVNAIAHRNYAIEGQAIEVLLFPDRVEFRSPGLLPEPVTIKELRAQRGIHRSRNPVMMRVLRDLGWTRDQGEGMARIFGSMRQVELHAPELEEVGDTFTVRLSTRSVHDAETQAWIAAYGPFGLRPEERRYMIGLRQAGGKRSVDKLARSLGESFDEVRAALISLEERGLVWRAKKTRSYKLVEPLNVPHERVYRLLESSGRAASRSTVLERSDIATMHAHKNADQADVSALIDQWKQLGVLTPAGSKRWKLGESILAYAAQRTTSA